MPIHVKRVEEARLIQESYRNRLVRAEHAGRALELQPSERVTRDGCDAKGKKSLQ